MKKILIIEDNPANRLLLSDIMKYHGYEINEAEDGEEGINLARESKPDLIFVDIQMPIMNGFEVIKALRADPQFKDVKLIAVTSFTMPLDRERIIALGADDYVAKPFDTRALPKLVEKHIGPGK